MAYKPLDIEVVKLVDLTLDLNNYRVPVASADESSAMKYLFASEDVMGAAKLILRNGYFDNEIPVVQALDEHRRRPPYVVLEGNRRVCALKAMANPDLVPTHAAEIRALVKRHAVEADDLPTEIRVMIAPTRESAVPHIARLHTGLSKRAWSPDQQANFYFSLLDSVTTPEDVKASFTGIKVPRYFRMASMRQFLAGAQFEDRSLREYVRSDALKMSVLEYAYKVSAIADHIGVHFDKNGLLIPADKTPMEIGASLDGKHLGALEYLVTEFRAERLTTRSEAFKKGSSEQDQLLEKLAAAESVVPQERVAMSQEPQESDRSEVSGPTVRPSTVLPLASHGEGAPNHGVSAGGSHRGEGVTAPALRGPNHADTKKRLPMEGIDYASTPVNLQNRYQELRRIDVQELPLASAVLLRSILETTIKYHFEGTDTPATGELRSVIDRVHSEYGSRKSLKAAIATVRSGPIGQPGSLQWFNRAAHDVDAATSAEQVRTAWKTVNPLIRHLLRKAPAATN